MRFYKVGMHGLCGLWALNSLVELAIGGDFKMSLTLSLLFLIAADH